MPKQDVSINVSVTFRNCDSTEPLKAYAIDKVQSCLKKYVNGPTDARVILSVQKRDHSAEVIVHSKGYDVSGTETTADLYSSIDKVVDNIVSQLRKQKEKLVSHK
ncbi:MAG: ribosome-associated translation inhibitor RaiA [Deltaproteobacteria bacterium]|nr:ribosome-associated translation inhibitor RaiA [Deltaproteobacteria bacterium]